MPAIPLSPASLNLKRYQKVTNDRSALMDAAATVDRIASGALSDLTDTDVAALLSAAKTLESVGCYLRRTVS
jgi:hypothetical protein